MSFLSCLRCAAINFSQYNITSQCACAARRFVRSLMLMQIAAIRGLRIDTFCIVLAPQSPPQCAVSASWRLHCNHGNYGTLSRCLPPAMQPCAAQPPPAEHATRPRFHPGYADMISFFLFFCDAFAFGRSIGFVNIRAIINLIDRRQKEARGRRAARFAAPL